MKPSVYATAPPGPVTLNAPGSIAATGSEKFTTSDCTRDRCAPPPLTATAATCTGAATVTITGSVSYEPSLLTTVTVAM